MFWTEGISRKTLAGCAPDYEICERWCRGETENRVLLPLSHRAQPKERNQSRPQYHLQDNPSQAPVAMPFFDSCAVQADGKIGFCANSMLAVRRE
jgi:hypothetical protein